MSFFRASFLALALAALLAPPAAAAPRSTKCFPRKAVVLQSSEVVRVYELRGSVVACLLPSGRRMRLGATGARGGTEVVALAVGGRYVAYALGRLPESAAGPFTSQTLLMIDMRKRRAVPIGATGCAGVEGAAVTVQSVVVTGGRQLAWICAATAGTAGRVEVHKFDGPARPRWTRATASPPRTRSP